MKEGSEELRELRVLIVEDSEDDTVTILRHLRLEGFEVEHHRVETAASMREALDQDSWDVIICDHALPAFDSFAALKIAGELESHTPFIVVSGQIGEKAAVEAMRAGADDYIMKDNMKRLGPAVGREIQHSQDQRAAKEDQVELEEQLRQSQKMEAVGQLAGGIAHDFNNILTVINSLSTVLLKEIEPDNPWHLDVTEIKNAGDRAAVLTRQLLAFSRKQILHAKVIDLGQVVAGMEGVLRPLIGERIELDLRIDPELRMIKADAGQIEQVVINLAVNARDAISETGSINLTVRNATLDGRAAASVGDVPGGDYVMLSVSDSGTGMDEETLPRIFEPFYTTKGVDKGTGLGLSTLFGIIKQSGGGIEVKSELGKGSEFRIYFPKVDASAQDADHEPEEPRTGPVEGRETILIVEDERVILDLLSHSLEKLGYTILVANHGEEALEIAKQYEGTIDMMITDVIMPRMGGFELAEKLAPIRPEMPVMFISGYEQVIGSSLQALKQVRKQIIQKPFDVHSLAENIRVVLDNPDLN